MMDLGVALKRREQNNLSASNPETGGPRLQPSNGNGRYLTVDEAASFLGISPGTLRNWVCRSKYEADPLPYTKFSSRCLRFLMGDLEVWAGRRGTGGGKC